MFASPFALIRLGLSTLAMAESITLKVMVFLSLATPSKPLWVKPFESRGRDRCCGQRGKHQHRGGVEFQRSTFASWLHHLRNRDDTGGGTGTYYHPMNPPNGRWWKQHRQWYGTWRQDGGLILSLSSVTVCGTGVLDALGMDHIGDDNPAFQPPAGVCCRR